MLVLSRDEVKEVTGAGQKAKQRRSLDALGIPYGVNLDGWPVVLRSEAIAALGGDVAKAKPAPREGTLDMSFLDA